jgi:hypothetical protein
MWSIGTNPGDILLSLVISCVPYSCTIHLDGMLTNGIISTAQVPGMAACPNWSSAFPLRPTKGVRTMRFNCVTVRHFQNDSASFSAVIPSKPIQWGAFPKQCLLSDMPCPIIGAFQNSQQEMANLDLL